MTILATIIRAIGLPAAIVIGLLAFYEGIPGAHRIPFLSSVPVIGDLATGRVHTYAAEQIELATVNLVSRFELTAAQAQLDKERQLREVADRKAEDARKRADIALKLKIDAQKALDARIAADTEDGGAVWTPEDLKWLGR